MCNAWNHPSWCRCGFGGVGHLGRSAPPTYRSFYPGRSNRWLRPFCVPTNCVCGKFVYFIKHNRGVVCLESLGKPWLIHHCPKANDSDEQPLKALIDAGFQSEEPILGIVVDVFLHHIRTTAYLEVGCANGDFASVECNYDQRHGDALEDAMGDLVLLFRSSQRIVHPLLGNCPTSRFKVAPQMPGYKLCKICSNYIDARFFDTHHQKCEAQARISGAPTLVESKEECASATSSDVGMPATSPVAEA